MKKIKKKKKKKRKKKKKKIEWERDLTFHTVERIPAASGIP